MTLTELKKMVKRLKVEAWIEAGVNVLTLGDSERISRLDHYAKALEFCSENRCKIPCGKIEFSNGKKVFYSIKKIK